MSSLSVVIISYRNPTYLDLCLKSVFENKVVDSTEVICVLDGFAHESSHVIEKYDGLNVLDLVENKGQTYAHNQGVIAASNDYVLLLNDDNVASERFDEKLLDVCDRKKVIAPNQIEPTPSIFRSFIIRNFGTSPEDFDYSGFLDFVSRTDCNSHRWGADGSTWPLCMSREIYLAMGGIDSYFPHPAMADWDFFLRCELLGLSCVRYFGTHFYHFGGAVTRKVDTQWNEKEAQSAEYFNYKWRFWPQRDKNNSLLALYHKERYVGMV